MAEKYFQEQELIAIKNKNANEYDKRMKQIEHKQKVNERLKRWKEKRKIIFLTYREYLSHKEAGTLPERFRIKLLRLYGGKNDLHYK